MAGAVPGARPGEDAVTAATTPGARLSLEHLTRFPDRAAGKAGHPAVIALHGRGSDAGDLFALAEFLDERLLWVAPRAPLELEGGFEWYRLAQVGVPDQPSFEAALRGLERFIGEALAAYPMDPRRLYLLGFSQGSMMAYAFTLTQPARVAGVIAHSGYIPLASVQAAARIDLDGLRGKPVVIAHGARDRMIPVKWAQAARDSLRAWGADVQYHEFPIDHHVSDRSLAAVDAWLQEQLNKAEQT
jgi:phospholipase/carboxylesterase